MNERIRELKLEAANWARQNHQAVDPENLTRQEYEQRVLMMTDKFAELIVRECAKKANAIALDIKIDSKLDARKYVGDSILKSFRVEE